MHELVLLDARVLELVDHDVLVAFLVLREDVGKLAEEPDRQDDQVVEVDGVEELEARLVFLVELLVLVVCAVSPALHADLDRREECADLVDVEGVGGEAEFPAGFLDQLVAVDVVVDAEVLAPAETGDVLAEDLDPEGVEGAHGEHLEFLSGQFLDALGHFPGGLVREGEGEDLGLRDALVEHIGHAEGDDPGFARARARNYENGSVDGGRGLVLLVVQFCSVIKRHGKRSITRNRSDGTPFQGMPGASRLCCPAYSPGFPGFSAFLRQSRPVIICKRMTLSAINSII